MPSLRTPRKVKNRRKTYRSHFKPPMTGGLRGDLKAFIDSKPMTPKIVNPASNFVVVTYWWGQGNDNKNTQLPCIAQLQEEYTESVGDELLDEDQTEDFPELENAKTLFSNAKKALAQNPTDKELAATFARTKKTVSKMIETILSSQAMRAKMNAWVNKSSVDLLDKGEGRRPIKFEEMIKMWEDHHAKLGCNYMAMNYEFERKDYQKAINAKPYFIEKALDACNGKSVLYIDGDMFVNKYPKIFDIDNVDFMARGWSMDPRSARDFKADGTMDEICFDPYLIETSGGTMFFSNTTASRKLLREWDTSSSLPINDGKADDRILSMVLTLSNWSVKSSVIQLPIEYLWLTNDYKKKEELNKISKYCDPIIEHPACLTSEDTATGGLTSREPAGYEQLISNALDCTYNGGIFYEFVFFPKASMVSAFGPYLTYLKTATDKKHSGTPRFKIVDYKDKYGVYNEVVADNIEKAKTEAIVPSNDGVALLSQSATIPQILAHLQHGMNVQIGDDTDPLGDIETDIRCSNTVDVPETGIVDRIQIDTHSPLYFGHKNPVVTHLVSMSRDLTDLNTHLMDSYIFVSRIRWNIKNGLPSNNVVPEAPAPLPEAPGGPAPPPPGMASISVPATRTEIVPVPQPTPQTTEPQNVDTTATSWSDKQCFDYLTANNIRTRGDWNRWRLANHPDKGGDKALFDLVTSCMDRVASIGYEYKG